MNALPTTRSFMQDHPLGCKPPREVSRIPWHPSDLAIPLVARNLWDKVTLAHLLWEIMDQDGIGSCNACAAAMSIEINREQQGLPRIPLSWGNLYGQINNGRDAGSILEDAHIALEQTGIADQTTIEADQWHAAKWPLDWEINARAHRLNATWRLPTFHHLASAALHGWAFDFGIPVGPTFDPDQDGVLPAWQGPIRGYHAMCGIGLKQIGQIWHIEAMNSWGHWGWRNSGRCWIPESYFTRPVEDAFAARVTTYSIRNQNHANRARKTPGRNHEGTQDQNFHVVG